MDIDFDTFSDSEKLTSDYSSKMNIGNRGPEPKIKLKKLKSIKLSRLPSRKSFKRESVFQDIDYFSEIQYRDDPYSEQSTRTEMSDALSTCTETTDSLSPAEDSIQNPVRRPLMPESSQGSEMRTIQTKLRSRKFTDSGSSMRGMKCQENQGSPSVKSSSSLYENKIEFQASQSDFDFSSGSDDLHTMNLQSLYASSTGHKTARKLIRKSSMKPDRTAAGMKAKRRKNKIPDHTYSSVARATCSSMLKNSKFPSEYNLEGIENVCEELSTGKVCKYSYCSLHGNHKTTEPSLKRFLSMKRRRKKSQKNLRPERSTLPRATIPVNIYQTRGMVRKQDCLITETKCTNTENSDISQKMGSDFAVNTFVRPKVQSKNIGIQTDDIIFSDNESPAQNPQSQISDISEKTLQTTVTSPLTISNSTELSRLGMKLDDALTEAIGTDQNKKHVAFSPCNEQNSSLPGVGPSDCCLSAPEDPSSLAIFSLNSSCAITSCSGEVSVDDKAPLSAESSSTDTDSDDYSFRLTSRRLKTKALSDVKEALYNSENLTFEKSEAAKRDIPGVDTKSISHSLEEGTSKKEDRGTESELEIYQRHSTAEVPDANSRADVPHTQFVKHKNASLWNLIYQNMASLLPTIDETILQSQGDENIEKEGRLSNMMHGKNNFVPSQRDPEAGHSAGEDDEDVGLQKVELTQSDAIKLVQEAIINILQLDVQGHKSGNHLTASRIPPQPNLQEVDQEKHLEASEPTSDLPTKQRSVDNTSSAEDGKVSSTMKSKPTMQLSKRWSTVRKKILLRRVVKTLGRMRNFSPKSPRRLPLELGPGSERDHLGRQLIDERRNVEEWMLDCALQQVISKLSSSQKQKVELLVEAFETVFPPTENESNWYSSAPYCPHADFVQSSNDSGVKTMRETIEITNIGTFPRTLFHQEEMSAHQTTITRMKREPDFGEILSESRFHKDGVIRIVHNNEIPVEEKVILELPKEITTASNPEVPNADLQLNSKNPEAINETCIYEEAALKSIRLIGTNSVKLTETDITVSLGPLSDSVGKAAAVVNINRNAGHENVSLQEHPQSKKHAETYIHSSNVNDDSQMEKKKQIKLWFMVYQRMLSGLSVEGSAEKLLNHEKEKQVDRDLGSENPEDCKTLEPYHAEAIKLVEEAIDAIVLTDSEDQLSDNQSAASYTASDQELHDDKQSEKDYFDSASAGDRFRETDKVNLRRSTVAETEKTWQNSRVKTQQQEKPVSKLGKKFNQKTSHWSKVRKLMRFINALDKVKKINPRQPRHLPLEAESETETVNLKHQEADDHKNSEEWMLDYAMQQAVARLTPARKRKVQLLVEAFETVMPTIKTEAH